MGRPRTSRPQLRRASLGVTIAMGIIPMIRCSRMAAAVAFYTEVLDFRVVEGGKTGDPSFSVLTRNEAIVFLSSHAGDGTYGQAIVVPVDDIDALVRRLRDRGLKTPGDPDTPQAVHEGPIDQTWGTREFYVDDPDGNAIRFVQGLTFGANGDA